MKKLIVGNFKMNTTVQEFSLYLDKFLPLIKNSKNMVALSLPYTHLMLASQKLVSTNVIMGCQNISTEEKGAYTGEVSNLMVKDLGAKFTLVGHSEIRKKFHETNEQINQKIIRTISVNLKSILCIGETKTEKNNNKTKQVLKKQIEIALKGLYENELKNIIIAYEPIWAIGTGKMPSVKEIEDNIAYLRKIILDIFSQKASEKIQILYGGSVNSNNFASILKSSQVDGLLVGGSCLDPFEFAKIVN